MNIVYLNDEEFEALIQLIDTAVRASGLQSVKAATLVLVKLEAAKLAATAGVQLPEVPEVLEVKDSEVL